MIITIDGPAGAGKSTIARRLAAGLGFDYLDTGSMYRAVALLGIRNAVDWTRPEELETLAAGMHLESREGRTFLNGEDVSDAVRTAEVTSHTRFAANNPAIRKLMVSQQRRIAESLQREGRNLVTEGRDQGSAVFPTAEYKFFLTAGPEERAKRRLLEWKERGEQGGYAEVLQRINQRDAEDSTREVGPLCKASDAIEIQSDGLGIDEVLDRLRSFMELRKKNNPKSADDAK